MTQAQSIPLSEDELDRKLAEREIPKEKYLPKPQPAAGKQPPKKK